MKTFKEFQEDYMGPAVTPKHYEPKDTIIRTMDVKMKGADKFRKGTGFNLPIPLAKRKYSGKINSDVLKSNPELNPDKPGDYIKLKRLSAKVKKA